MPIYEYHCEDCGKDFECLVMRSDDTSDCPHCQGDKTKRLMSACGFLSKGAGGETVGKSAGASACTGCPSTNCGTCGH
jgi:putative FmdB family regulatory protein